MTDQRIKDHLQGIIRQAEAEIDAIHRKQAQGAHARELAQSSKFNAMTPEQQRYCQFMGFDPDNPDIPLD